jgi:hypothetical protein
METQPQITPKTGILTHVTKWMIALPMFAALMAYVTTKSFYGNALWETLRATGDSAAT